MSKSSDAQRHSTKINQFKDAIKRVGRDTVAATIGENSTNGFMCAKDAQDRRKDQDMIGWFLSYAQDSAYEFCSLQPDEDVYVVLDSLLPTPPMAMPDFHRMERPALSAWYIQNVGYDIGAEDPDMSLESYRAHCVEYFAESQAC